MHNAGDSMEVKGSDSTGPGQEDEEEAGKELKLAVVLALTLSWASLCEGVGGGGAVS